VSAGSFTIIASPVVLSKLFHQKNLSSVLKRKRACILAPLFQSASITTVAEAKPLITAFRIGKEISWELLRAGIEKAPFPYWRFVLGGQRFLSDKFASALSL